MLFTTKNWTLSVQNRSVSVTVEGSEDDTHVYDSGIYNSEPWLIAASIFITIGICNILTKVSFFLFICI